MTRIGYVIGTYPQLTTTFIDREVARLCSRGISIELISIRRPTTALSAEQQDLEQRVRYLLPASALGLARHHLRFARRRAYWEIAARLLSRRHPSHRARLRTLLHFAAGVEAAAALSSQSVDRVHAHFVDRAAVAAMVAARLLDVPYSVTAHAADIYVDPVLLDEKVRVADFVATCTRYNQAHLERVVPGLPEGKVVLVHHGLDLERYRPATRPDQAPPVVLAVGQLKEKKGLSDLVEACHLLRRRGRELSCVIVGDGPLRRDLVDQVQARELALVVDLTGALPHDEVISWYRRADVFALPCTTADDGDRDGLPNVVLEAMAMALPVVSTTTSAIGEAVVHGCSGLLVPPDRPAELADALDLLLQDPELRARFGRNGRHIAHERFDVERNVEVLADRLKGALR